MTFAERLAAYLSRTTGRPTRIENLARIPGGASRETYRYDAVTDDGREGFILRRDPPGSLIETDRRAEYLAIRSFAGKDVAAPEAVALEEEGAELERPFFIMRRVDKSLRPGSVRLARRRHRRAVLLDHGPHRRRAAGGAAVAGS